MSREERELRELENPENWDWEKAERQPPVQARRTIVSVAFARAEFAQVAKYAQSIGMKTSEFIRRAALERASARTEQMAVRSASGSNGFVFFSELVTGVDPRFPRGTEEPKAEGVIPIPVTGAA